MHLFHLFLISLGPLFLSSCLQPKSYSHRVVEKIGDDLNFPGSTSGDSVSAPRDSIDDALDEMDRAREERARDRGRGSNHGGFPDYSPPDYGQHDRQRPWSTTFKGFKTTKMQQRLARVYEIPESAVVKLLEALAQARQNDLRGLKMLGLNEAMLERAVYNNGRLQKDELYLVGRKLGISVHKADELVHHFIVR